MSFKSKINTFEGNLSTYAGQHNVVKKIFPALQPDRRELKHLALPPTSYMTWKFS